MAAALTVKAASETLVRFFLAMLDAWGRSDVKVLLRSDLRPAVRRVSTLGSHQLARAGVAAHWSSSTPAACVPEEWVDEFGCTTSPLYLAVLFAVWVYSSWRNAWFNSGYMLCVKSWCLDSFLCEGGLVS